MEVLERVRKLEKLNIVAAEITAQRDMSALLRKAIEGIVDVLDASGGGFYIYGEQQQMLVDLFNIGPFEDHEKKVLKLGEGLVGRVVETGLPLIVDDYSNWSGRTDLFPLDKAPPPSVSVIGVPVKRSDKIIGVVFATDRPGKSFASDDLDLLTLFANLLAGAIQSAQTEKALRESEAKYRLLFEISPEAIFVFDAETFQILTANDTAVARYGFSQKTFLSMKLSDLWTDEDMPELLSTLTSPASYDFKGEWKTRKSDGSIIWVDITSQAIEFSGRRARLVIASDITERKRAAAALQNTNEALDALVQGSPLAIIAVDFDCKVTKWNTAAELIFGWREDEVLGKPLPILPEERAAESISLKELLSGTAFIGSETGRRRRDGSVETRRRKRDGSLIDISISIAPLRNAQGRLQGMMALMADITERKRAGEKMREQAALLDITKDAIIVRDLEDRILYCNRGAETLFKLKHEEAVGTNANSLIFVEELAKLKEARSAVLAAGEWSGELRHTKEDGETAVFESRWTLMRDNYGNPRSILTVNSDVTEKKGLEMQFFRVQRMESIGTLASGIAHDLNNVLTPILMSIEILKKRLPDEHSRKLLNTLQEITQRGANLIKQVLSYGRGYEGEHVRLELSRLILEIETMLKASFPKSIRIKTEIPDEDLWTVSANATQMHQVLMNLCVNARDAMSAGGTLTISAENTIVDEEFARLNIEAKAGRYAAISVKDTGSGIPAEIMERIFDPFFTTKEFGKGTGLGLSTVLGIVKGHGGFVKTDSEVGGGSEFKVYIPAIAAAEKRSPEKEPSAIALGHGELVLVIDDEAAILKATQETLDSHNYKVITAPDGIEAISIYVEHKDEIEIVLTDVMMPIMDGPATIRALQKINPNVKVIVMGGLISEAQIDDSIKTNIYATLPKPYTAEELLNALHEVLL